MNDTRPQQGRWILVTIAILFIGPLAVAMTLYLSGLWRPGAGVNHGILIQPVMTLPRAAQPLANGGATEGGYLYGKWTLVHLADRGCDPACQAAVVKTRQIRVALGKEIDRIDRVIFVYNTSETDLFAGQPDLLVVKPTGAAGTEIVDALVANGGTSRIFLVDPLGNLILSYPLAVDPADIRDDLKRLLRLSMIG